MNARPAEKRSGLSPVVLAVLLRIVLVLVAGRSAHARQIHYFKVFCDGYPGDSGAINPSVSVDRMIVNGIFAENINEQSWGITQTSVDISGENANAPFILARWEEFSKGVAAEDTVFVYFSGHGAIADRAVGDVLLQTCDLKLINREEWGKAIDALPCNLKIFITDCCSSYLDEELAEGDEEVQPWDTLYYLLLKHEGFVNITAASPGQSALGTPAGGYLTVNLLSDMQRHRTWDEVFKAAAARVHEEVTEQYRKKGVDVAGAQKPFCYGLAKPLFNTGGGQGQAQGDQANDFIIADSQKRRLSRADLQGFGLQQLYFSRNEIFARHGYDFSTPLLKFYFSSRSWYRLRPGFKEPDLSPVEAHNSDLILAVEKSKGGPFAPGKIILPGQGGDGAPPDIFPYSSTTLLTRSAVEKLSLKELSIARNEIYSRYGYPFQSATLRQHFGKKPNYSRNPGATSPAFNAIERQNLWLIEKLERIKGGPHNW